MIDDGSVAIIYISIKVYICRCGVWFPDITSESRQKLTQRIGPKPEVGKVTRDFIDLDRISDYILYNCEELLEGLSIYKCTTAAFYLSPMTFCNQQEVAEQINL